MTKSLRTLLRDIDIIACSGNLDVMISGITHDSRKLGKNGCFVAIKGFRQDGLKYLNSAVEKGIAAVITCTKPDPGYKQITWVQVKNERRVLSKIVSRFYKDVIGDLYTIGITGTNAKTTIMSFIAAILAREAKTAGVGTLGMRFGDTHVKTGLTTPEVSDLYPFLADARRDGVENLVMEVSSVALRLYRVEDVKFSQAIFTTFSGDHLDFHKTMEDYLASKVLLFKKLEDNDWAVINIDDPSAYKFIEQLDCKYLTYGFSPDADVRPLSYKLSLSGIRARLQTPRGVLEVNSSLLGRVNLSNLMAAVTSAVIKGVSFENITAAVEEFKSVKGRLDVAYKNDFAVLVDYAHTDHALEALLKSMQEITKGRVIVVFGAGGDRDKTKRPRMGEAASKYADFVVITSDNPRSENPNAIVKDIIEGLEPGFRDYIVEIDRETAIKKALDMAVKGDLVVVAGKGHEDYQVFKDKTIHFDDYEVVRKIMENKKNA